jgi:hypothetical protein
VFSEIREYAKWLGMDVEAEQVVRMPITESMLGALLFKIVCPPQDLLWIARQGLKAPLPPQWKPWYGTFANEALHLNKPNAKLSPTLALFKQPNTTRRPLLLQL